MAVVKTSCTPNGRRLVTVGASSLESWKAEGWLGPMGSRGHFNGFVFDYSRKLREFFNEHQRVYDRYTTFSCENIIDDVFEKVCFKRVLKGHYKIIMFGFYCSGEILTYLEYELLKTMFTVQIRNAIYSSVIESRDSRGCVYSRPN